MSHDLNGLRAQLKAAFSDYALEEESSDDKVTFELRKGWAAGVEVELEDGKASVEWSTKAGLMTMLGALGLTFVLMMLFGDAILSAIGLIADTGDGGGVTLKLFYIIPMVVFLIPSMILASVAKGKIAPVQEDVLTRAREAATGNGYVLQAD